MAGREPTVRVDVVAIGPSLDPRQLRNLVGLVFVEESDPPALVILLDRVALGWGPVAEDKQAAWAEEVKETWVEPLLVQAQRGRRLAGVIAWSKDGVARVECWDGGWAFPEAPDEWLDAAVKRAVAARESHLPGGETFHGASRIAEWRDQLQPAEQPERPDDPNAAVWVELVEAIHQRMIEGAKLEMVVIESIGDEGPELGVLHCRQPDRGVAGYHDGLMSEAFDLLAEFREQILRLLMGGRVPRAVLMRMADGQPKLICSEIANTISILPSEKVEQCANDWLHEMGGSPMEGRLH